MLFRSDAIANQIINQGRFPIFVAEGTTVQKLSKIKSIPYLDFCLKKLEASDGAVFVVGHSADERDDHVYDAIAKSKIERIYFCVYDPGKNLAEIKERVGKYRIRSEKYRAADKKLEIRYVDGTDLGLWNTN